MEKTIEDHPLVEVIGNVVRDHNRMWASGTIAEDSVLRDVEEDLVASQYAPHFEGGVWRATSGEEWLAGTAEAGAFGCGQGWSWSHQDLTVLPRSDDECVATYRIVHSWGDADRKPAQAIFLETWRRGDDGCWRLARHTAEKL